MPQDAMDEDYLISKKCDAHALFRYSTRVKHPGCYLNEGKTMSLLTEISTVSQS